MDELKKLLGDELFKQVETKLGDKKLLIDDGKLIPKTRFDEVNEKMKSYVNQLDIQKSEFEKQLKSVNDQLKNLDDTTKLTAEQKESIKKLTESNTAMQKDYSDKLKEQQKQHLIDLTLIKAEAKNVKSVKALLDVSKISLDGENIIGIDDQLKSLKEKEAYLFGETKREGGTPGAHDQNPGALLDDVKLFKSLQEQYSKNPTPALGAQMIALQRKLRNEQSKT
jgi:hypothetical protein